MEIREFNREYGITGLNKSMLDGRNKLAWNSESSEITNYVVVFGAKIDAVLINKNEELRKHLTEDAFLLKNNRKIAFDSNMYGTITCSYLTFVDLKKNGFFVPAYPGYYAVYGCKVDNNEITILYDGDGVNNLKMNSVTFDIVKTKVYTEGKKGLWPFGKKGEKIYSGYTRITVKNGYPGIGPGIIKYNCNRSRSVFSVPQKIIENKNGGVFYVKSSEEESISLFTNNIDTVKLIVEEE